MGEQASLIEFFVLYIWELLKEAYKTLFQYLSYPKGQHAILLCIPEVDLKKENLPLLYDKEWIAEVRHINRELYRSLKSNKKKGQSVPTYPVKRLDDGTFEIKSSFCITRTVPITRTTYTHCEEILIERCLDPMKSWAATDHKIKTILLYTLHLPCESCRDIIIDNLIKKSEHRNMQIVIVYSSTEWNKKNEGKNEENEGKPVFETTISKLKKSLASHGKMSLLLKMPSMQDLEHTPNGSDDEFTLSESLQERNNSANNTTNGNKERNPASKVPISSTQKQKSDIKPALAISHLEEQTTETLSDDQRRNANALLALSKLVIELNKPNPEPEFLAYFMRALGEFRRKERLKKRHRRQTKRK